MMSWYKNKSKEQRITLKNAFRRVEVSYLHDFCKSLRPDCKLPTRKNIGGLQLDKAYNKLQRRVNEVMSKKLCLNSLNRRLVKY